MDVDPSKVSVGNMLAALDGESGLNPFDQSIETGTRFTGLDILASVKCTALVEARLDLYPHDPMSEDVVVPAQANPREAAMQLRDGASYKDMLVCQLNWEHIEGVRLLPASILSNPSPSGSTSATVIESALEKDYGITGEQKAAITNRLLGPSKAGRAVDMLDWEQGEHNYFEDQVKILGLEYDFNQLKSGMPKAQKLIYNNRVAYRYAPFHKP
ncbi:hypothetical protein L1987_53941 [Smallanthus sonchifolius]|uniref:Uncharacterized protein n=1 Tax=Smallanthus sonchifolius TaxID=185202 RepID=A0ACB9E592_9ASTR|nr:hypothetical protein L1987_53941 [Smallanthus sonchifolius]